jgi:hypothetical protein
MKKMFTLVLTAILISGAAFAQYGPKDYGNNGNGNGNGRNTGWNDNKGDKYGKGAYYFSARDRDMEIADINREYDRKMQVVKNRFFMSRRQKEAQLCALDDQRKMEIKQVWAKFNDRKNKYGDYRPGRNW